MYFFRFFHSDAGLLFHFRSVYVGIVPFICGFLFLLKIIIPVKIVCKMKLQVLGTIPPCVTKQHLEFFLTSRNLPYTTDRAFE
jgi:hypothetical protein